MKFQRKILFIGIFILFLASCDYLPFSHHSFNDSDKLPWFFEPNILINSLIDSVEGNVDAIQLFTKSEKEGISPPGSMSVEMSSAQAIYYINHIARQISNVECNNNRLIFKTDMKPIHYNYSWEYDKGPECNSNLYWKTVFKNETIYDTLTIPNGFSDMSFGSDSLNLKNGGNLTWSTISNGKVAVFITWSERFTDGKTGWSYTSYYGTIPDNGSFAITSKVLRDAGVPDSSSKVAGISITLYKWNLKTKYYDSGTKQLVNIALVENGAFLWVEQEK